MKDDAPACDCVPVFRRVESHRYEVTWPSCAYQFCFNDAAMQGRVAPAYEDGKQIGLELSAFRPRSYLYAAGLEDGDVVEEVNGHELTSPDKFLQAYSDVRDANHLHVWIRRDSRRLELVYDVRTTNER